MDKFTTFEKMYAMFMEFIYAVLRIFDVDDKISNPYA